MTENNRRVGPSINTIMGDSNDSSMWSVKTHAPGPKGSLPITGKMLIDEPSGNIFGLTQSAGMGWPPSQLLRKQFLVLSTMGGLRNADGSPAALGFHTGHYELGLLVEQAAQELEALETMPFAAYCSDPCDGRTQGTSGMLDSLPFRNDAAIVLRRQARSLPTACGIVGIATCDKGLPAMMMALAGLRSTASVIVPGGVTLAPEDGEDAGRVQSIGARYSQGELSLEEAQDLGCRACASPGGGCQFLGTAGTSQVIAEALGMALTHTALAPSGLPIWLNSARRSAQAVVALEKDGRNSSNILTDAAIQNAMVVYAAVGGSTNLLLHLPAIAHAAGLNRPKVDDWSVVNKSVPRIVDVLPNGPIGHPTSQFFAAGGVPEVMLHLRRMGLLNTSALTATGQTLDANLDWWKDSKRRQHVRSHLTENGSVDPDDVIMSPEKARERGLTSTITFPTGNLAPEGSVIKSTAIDPKVLDKEGVYRHTGGARVFHRERDAIRAIKSKGPDSINPGDIMVLTCGGPMGTGMEEVFQITAALKYLSYGNQVTLITDARFSGVSTGACIGHVGPEALAGGPIGRVRDGDLIQVIVDTRNLEGSIDLVGENGKQVDPSWGVHALTNRNQTADLSHHPDLPDDTRLWAGLQAASGGTWGGCVFDVDEILQTLEAGRLATNDRGNNSPFISTERT